MLKIGDIEMKNQVVLAPMAGVCNPAFRLIAKEFGTGLVCAEMVSDKAIIHGNKRTQEMLFVDEREKPLSLQIFGGDRESLVEAAKVVDQDTDADIIDINMGCPVPKVTKCDAGARWLLDPNKIFEMVSAVVAAVSKPVTVKMRIGWDSDHIYVIDNAKAVEAAGGKAVSVHGRTREQPVYRQGGLELHPAGQGSRVDPCHRERRRGHAGGCQTHAGRNRLRRGDDRTRSARQSVDVVPYGRISQNGRTASGAGRS